MHVLYSFPTRLGTPGIGTTAWHQVASLAEQDVQVTVACASCERPLPESVRVMQTLRLGSVKLPFRVLGLERSVALHDARTAAILRRLAGAVDVVHAWPLGAERTLAAARRLGVPGLLERPNAHTGFAFAAVETVCRQLGIGVDAASPHARRPGRLAREQREYELADGLLCPSEFVARTFREAGVPAERLLRHRYGFDPARFTPGPAGANGERRFTVAFVGRGEPRKGLHYALDAWLASGAADTGRFLVAGEVEPAYERVLRSQLAHPSVQALGRVADPAGLMRESDVLVLPSVEEGSALVTYEARGSGCVLAVSDHAGAVCTHEVDGLVHEAGDVGALTGHLRALSSDPDLLRRLRGESLRGAADLTWSSAGRVLASAYRAGLRRAEPVRRPTSGRRR